MAPCVKANSFVDTLQSLAPELKSTPMGPAFALQLEALPALESVVVLGTEVYPGMTK